MIALLLPKTAFEEQTLFVVHLNIINYFSSCRVFGANDTLSQEKLAFMPRCQKPCQAGREGWHEQHRWGSGWDGSAPKAQAEQCQVPHSIQGKSGTKYGGITHRNCIMVRDSVRAMQSLVQMRVAVTGGSHPPLAWLRWYYWSNAKGMGLEAGKKKQ